MKKIKDLSILEQIKNRNLIWRFISLCIGSFIVALVYNSYVKTNNIVYGGMGGLAILANHQFGISTSLFINLSTILLICISFILLGHKKTSYSVVGFVVYAIMINITEPIAHYILLDFDSFLFSIFFYSTVMGIGYGLIYKTGFNTGGADAIVAIVQEYLHMPTGKTSNIINGIIVFLGLTLFGYTNTIYAVIYLKVCNFMTDFVILGESTSKLCFIKTRYRTEVEQYITEELDIGYTVLDSTNGIGFLKKHIIMCVIPSDRFYDLKHEVQAIDKKAYIISNDCYTVIGGRTNELIPI